MSCAKMAEWIEILFGLWTQMGQGRVCYMEGAYCHQLNPFKLRNN